MTVLSDGPRARLFTVFGTVLYADAESGLLRHGPVESSPANAVFVAEPGWGPSHRKGRLMLDKGDGATPISCLSDHCQAISSRKRGRKVEAGTLLELVPLERGLVALTAQDLFLTAEPGGAVYLTNSVCSTWECFLASEDWCSFGADDEHLPATPNSKFDTKRIQAHLVHPLIRKRANAKSTATKVLIYGYPQWSHGRVYCDLCKHLHRHGYIVDILNWQENHSDYFAELFQFYDLFMTALDGVRTLTDTYSVPYDKIIALSHHELDIRMLIEQNGVEVFEKFANYGVVSEFVYCASLMKGVPRVPKVVPLGVDFAEFHSKISERLATVGFAGSMSVTTYGIEWKRGELAEAAAREAGLEFRVAGSTAKQISFHDMPEFYRSVDAVLTSSISEAAQLPVMEAAAAGRLVICTPVGHFPRKAYEGGGILAPVEAAEFKAFTAKTLRYFKDNPAAYRDKCHAIQEAAKQFDWKYTIDAWVDLIETAMAARRRTLAAPSAPTSGKSPASGESQGTEKGWTTANINTVCKSVKSESSSPKPASARLIDAVDASLSLAHSAAELDATQGFFAIEGMSGKKYRLFINTLVKMLADTSYLEVGSWAGSTLCSAIYGNKVRAVAIDNWSQFGGPKDLFYRNLKTFSTAEVNVSVFESDFRAVDYRSIGTFDIYLFDGPHEEKDQYDGLDMALSALGDSFVFIVDDWNWRQVRQGTLAAIRDCNLDVLYAAEIRTSLDNTHPSHSAKESDWHNGYYISVLAKRTLVTTIPDTSAMCR